MDTIKIIKGVFNNEDIIKDNNAIAAAFSDGTVIGIDTKNDDKFQKDFLSSSGNKDEKEIYISTIDMLTPEAEVQVNNGGKRLTVKGVRCKNVSHSDSNKSIPEAAVDTLSKLGSYTALTLQMPDSASWNFDGNGTATTDVTFSAKGKSDSVKSTTKHGKFVVTQPIKINHYAEADGELPAQSTVYRKGNSSFEGAAIQQAKRFQKGKQISACAEVTPATKKRVTVNDSGILSQSIASNDKWLDISCSAHSCLVVKYGNNASFSATYSGTVQTKYETAESEIESGALVKIGIYKQNTKITTKTFENFNASSGVAAGYGGCSFSFSYGSGTRSGTLTAEGKIPTGGNISGTLTVNVNEYESIYSKVNEYSYTPDNNLFYAGLYCRNSGWYDAEGDTANKGTAGKIYSIQPTAGSGFKFDGEEMFYTKTGDVSATANDKLCNVDGTGEVTFKKDADFKEKESYSKDGDPSFSVSFD